jgi:hypothetical protein
MCIPAKNRRVQASFAGGFFPFLPAVNYHSQMSSGEATDDRATDGDVCGRILRMFLCAKDPWQYIYICVWQSLPFNCWFFRPARIFDSSFSFLHITQHDHEYDVSMTYWIHIISKHLRCFCLVLCHIQNFFGRDPQHLPWKSARIWLNSCCTCTRSVRQTGEISATRLGKLLRRQLEDGIGFRELIQHILPITKW